ncbi:AAA domain-containing protein [Aureliella helgolandensis]|uniref:DNA helicase n=1 Tax=Aureliella helgolandensis TaxID=2527968 RepID=A0A518G5E4_9BACT|nr:AAA domain-containing protein [Aureliella helgolandensis]QDV23811.1 ATP-dependent RecD-like DNA helicase [Aureliella helgolandensis]
MNWFSQDAYFSQLERWLSMEAEAERQRLAQRRQLSQSGNAERGGETIVGLFLTDHRSGLAGRLLLDFAKGGSDRLPMNRLKVGSPVVLSNHDNLADDGISGVVSRRTPTMIQVAVDQWHEADRYRIDLSPDETTRQRQLEAMDITQTLTGKAGRLRDVLLGFEEPRFVSQSEVAFRSDLNPPQQDAVRFAMSARDVAILHGPPGTGKTTTLAEIIVQEVEAGGRVLACAPSNTAVDNLLERLVTRLPKVVRVGHPARVFESLRGHTLDELVESDSSAAIVRDIWKDVDQLMRAAKKESGSWEGKRARGEMYAEAGRLRKEAKSLERSTLHHIVDSANVICTTTTIDEDLLGMQMFDLVVIDEACQCTEPAVWQAMLRAERIVLAGDHCQLPPTVVSKEAAQEGFSRSLMERLIERFGSEIYRRLVVQYRMHESIMRFSSDHFYDGELIADPSVSSHRLVDLPRVHSSLLTEPVIEFWDTAGTGWEEELERDGQSKLNRKEARWIVEQVEDLLDDGVAAEQIAVIAPYAAQVRYLRNRLQIPDLEIDTVDGFQGREKEAVLITFVRSNPEGEIGFLADTRRTNVALTRARRSLRVIGDSATLTRDPFYRQMLDYFELHDAYHSVWELGDV